MSARVAAQSGDTFNTAIPLGVVGGLVQRTGTVGPAVPEDWYSFVVQNSVRDIAVGLASGIASSVDVAVLRDANNDGVPEILGEARMFSSGGTLSVWLDPGTYFIRLKNAGGLTSYQLGLSSEAKPDSDGEENNSLTKATDIGRPTTLVEITDFLGPPDVQDWYRFEVRDQVRITRIGIAANLRGSIDVSVLRDANGDGVGELLASSRIFSSGGSISVWLDPGVYFLRFQEVGGNTEYSFGISSEARAASPGEANNSLQGASDLGTPTTLRTIHEFVGNPDLEDWYRLRVESSVRELNLGIASGLSETVDLYVLRDLNNDGVPEVLASRRVFSSGGSLSLWLDPGTYFIRVEKVGGNTEYQLGISTDPKPESPGETNNVLSKSTDIGAPTVLRTIEDFIGLSDTEDWYRFRVRGVARRVNAGIAGGIDATIDMYLMQDANNDGVAETIESTRVFSSGRSIEASLNPGTYFIRLTEVGGNTTYRLGISQSLPTNTPPFILTQPAEVTVIEGRPAKFSVEADGSGSLAYQWFRNDSPLNGKTSPDLVFSSTSSTDAGVYHVQITSSHGVATSARVQLIVNPAAFEVQISDAVILSWPVSAGDGVVVEGTDDMDTPASWREIPVPVVTVGNRREAAIRRQDQFKFYRLRKP